MGADPYTHARRDDVLEALRALDRPAAAAEVAAVLGPHPTPPVGTWSCWSTSARWRERPSSAIAGAGRGCSTPPPP